MARGLVSASARRPLHAEVGDMLVKAAGSSSSFVAAFGMTTIRRSGSYASSGSGSKQGHLRRRISQRGG